MNDCANRRRREKSCTRLQIAYLSWELRVTVDFEMIISACDLQLAGKTSKGAKLARTVAWKTKERITNLSGNSDDTEWATFLPDARTC